MSVDHRLKVVTENYLQPNVKYNLLETGKHSYVVNTTPSELCQA